MVERAERDLEWERLCSLQRSLIKSIPTLRCATLPEKIFKSVCEKNVTQVTSDQPNALKLTRENYTAVLKTLLLAEEAYESIQIRESDQAHTRLKRIPDPNKKQPFLLEARVQGLSHGEPKVIPTDFVVLEEKGQLEQCMIVDMDNDNERIVFKRLYSSSQSNGLLAEATVESREFTLAFVSSGGPYINYHKALDHMREHYHLKDVLFEPPGGQEPQLDGVADRVDIEFTATETLTNRLNACNERQRQAIMGILKSKCRPRPYIVFGPPGTGKTTTLVEAIIQLYCRNERLNILVTANSNNCADQLASLIHASGLVHSMARYVSSNHYREKAVIQDYDVVIRRKLSGCRLIVTTNNKAFCLVGQMKFDFVIVDEAGHAHEAETVIPILNLNYGGCIVLAGDPKQLGPVIRCREVDKLGLGGSTLERLFELKAYARNPIDGKYDDNYITKLIESYRCDPRIMEPSSKLFYDDELQCLGKCPPELLAGMNFNHPLVFHPVDGLEGTAHRSTSHFNELEADICVGYVGKLHSRGVKPDKISVITPYQLQKEMLREKLALTIKKNKAVHDSLGCCDCMDQAGDRMDICTDPYGRTKETCSAVCKADTIDAFQGQEKEVIIISTVRTPILSGDGAKRAIPFDSKFLTDSKRFNVAITRAKWLVIVVGHPAIITSHPNWEKFGQSAEYVKR